MKKKIFIYFLIGLFMLISLGNFSLVQSENETEIQKAVSYLKSQPQDSWITMALAAAGETDINLEHLKSIPQDQQSTTSYAKYILALTANGQNPTSFGNENYVERLKNFYNLNNKQFGDESFINDDIWAILALGALGQEDLSIVQDAKDFILNNQNLDGGWGYATSASSDSNDTAAGIMALLEAGISSDSSQITKAVNYLKSVQNADGGFAYFTGEVSDSASDAWVISAIYKLGQDPTGSDWTKNSNNAVLHLKSLQDEDGGFWWQKTGDNKMNTSWAVIALAEKYFPVYTIYNKHSLRIEGEQNTICDFEIYGNTPLDLAMNAAEICDYDYQIIEYPFGLYLKKINQETDGWMYMINNIEAQVGSADYYLLSDDEVLFYFGQWLEKGWHPTKIELNTIDDLVKIQVKYFQEFSWQNLEVEEMKIQIGDVEFSTNSLGQVELALSSLENGFYEIFVETQVIQDIGYIRSEKNNLTIGDVPDDHTAGLVVEIETVTVPPEGDQPSISFSVSPDMLDFGKLKPGESSDQSINISNGADKIYLEIEITGASVFQDNLDIDEQFWQFFSAQLAENQNKNFTVELNIPVDYNGDFGKQEAELIFWAIKQ